MHTISLEKQFLHPSDEFTPIPFWFWNDLITEEELLRQIADFADKGVMGFVIHPRMGIPDSIPYLSDTYMNLVLTAVKEASRRGMRVILYDEAMYPSGSAKGMVVQGNPEYASRGLKMVECSGASRVEIASLLEEGDVLVSAQAVQRSASGSLLSDATVVLKPSGGAITLAPGMDAEGQWSLILFIETYSHGTIRGVHFGEDDGEPNAPASADLLNRDATDKFLRLTHDRYYEWLKDHFGHTVIAMFTDEPEILGRRHRKGLKPWTRDFLTCFLEQGNKEADLPLLWLEDSEGASERVRSRYRKAVQRRLTDSYYKPISDWCAAHGIALTGHPAASDDIGLLEQFHIPGQDVVWRWVAPENNLGLEGRHSTAGKCTADAARHRGRRRNLNEVLGVCGLNNDWNLSAGDMKWYLDWLFVRGVNMISPHAFYYSVDGPRRYNERPPDVGPNNIWWPHYKTIAEYIKRMSWLMTDSANTTSVAVLCREDWMPWRIAKPLYEHQWEFNYLEENLLTTASKIHDGRIHMGDNTYSVVVIEEGDRLDPQTVLELTRFVKQGGRIIELVSEGTQPYLEGAIAVADTEEVVTALGSVLRPALRFHPQDPALRVSCVTKDGQHFLLIVNEGEERYEGHAALSMSGYVEEWDAWSGAIRSIHTAGDDAGVSIPVSLERRQSIIYRVDPTRSPEAVPPTARASTRSIVLTITEGWTAEASEFPVQPPALGSWTEQPALAHASGTVTYRSSFRWDHDMQPDRIELDLGEAHELAEVRVNGEHAGVVMWSPYRFDITALTTSGLNQLEVVITNSLANRIDKLSLPSGLIGPVTIQTYSAT